MAMANSSARSRDTARKLYVKRFRSAILAGREASHLYPSPISSTLCPSLSPPSALLSVHLGLIGAMRETTEADVLRYHYAQLANLRNIHTAAIEINAESRRRASLSHSHSSGSSKTKSKSPSLPPAPILPSSAYGGIGISSATPTTIDPVLLALDLERQVEQLGQLARAVVGSALGQGSVATGQTGAAEKEGKKGKGGAGRKRRRTSEVEVDSALVIDAGAVEEPAVKPKKKKAAARASLPTTTTPSNPDPATSTSINTFIPPSSASSSPSGLSAAGTSAPIQPMAVPTAHLLKSRPRPKSSLPAHLSTSTAGAGHTPLTPRTSLQLATGMEMDELSTPLQPQLFGRGMPPVQTAAGTPARLGMTGRPGGIGVGVGVGRVGAGWAVGTPGVPRSVGGV